MVFLKIVLLETLWLLSYFLPIHVNTVSGMYIFIWELMREKGELPKILDESLHFSNITLLEERGFKSSI